jgi:segregation and condensation protein B
MLEDAAPMAAAAQLGQAVMEFDPSATVETVVIDTDAQEVIEIEEETTEITAEEIIIDISELDSEEVTPESEDNPDETK